ncbi:hypothetical protein RDV89_00160 [Nocardioides zeae]|uniref:Glycosyl transferase family 28 C-terminal domain-containing protein n=1 Tax=Nocardioides imazamoxiresistens TaxID=3231893 RepID=A0ABU3PQG7_9ACTN|nr:hypothetical protein [Nocardioides zeae]MDT9591457.1 hypothetical protein [Nocardioides zeae]
MSAPLRVGWYVHHHGHGHLHRALAVAEELHRGGAEVTVLSSREPTAHPAVADWVELPRDDDGSPHDVTAGGVLHWVPRHHDGLLARSARISAWLERHRPDVVVCDVSQEVALLCRLHGVPVVSVVQAGERSDLPHRVGLAAADALVACWPPAAGRLVTGLPDDVADRVVAVGGLSRFPVRTDRRTAREGGVLVLGGSGGDAWTPGQVRALAVAADRDVRVLGRERWDPRPQDALAAADVVVVQAGQNALAEVAAARVPAVVVAAERPFDEQRATAAALRLGPWPAVVLDRLEHDDWPTLLAEVAALDGERWSAWCDGDAARRFAAVVRRVGLRGLVVDGVA